MATTTTNLPTREGLRMLLGVAGDYDTLGVAALAFGETILANCPPTAYRDDVLFSLARVLTSARALIVFSEPAPAQAEEG